MQHGRKTPAQVRRSNHSEVSTKIRQILFNSPRGVAMPLANVEPLQVKLRSKSILIYNIHGRRRSFSDPGDRISAHLQRVRLNEPTDRARNLGRLLHWGHMTGAADDLQFRNAHLSLHRLGN